MVVALRQRPGRGVAVVSSVATDRLCGFLASREGRGGRRRGRSATLSSGCPATRTAGTLSLWTRHRPAIWQTEGFSLISPCRAREITGGTLSLSPWYDSLLAFCACSPPLSVEHCQHYSLEGPAIRTPFSFLYEERTAAAARSKSLALLPPRP